MSRLRQYRWQMHVPVHFLALLTLPGVLTAQTNPVKGRISAREFAISPWGGMPSLQENGAGWGVTDDYDKALQDLWECGFNLTGFAPREIVPHAVKHGLSVLLENDLLRRDMSAGQATAAARSGLAEYTGATPPVFALNLQDEPGTADFPHLAKWSRAVTAANPAILPYISLFPNYASPGQLVADSYEDYIDQFVAQCAPKLLIYNNYSLQEDGLLQEDRFYSNLETIREKSLQYQLPFWNIILGNSHFKYAEPTRFTIAIQVFSSLAYGARGISYFTYYAPRIGNYRLAAIDQFGHRTPTWDLLRLMNLQLHKLAPTYTKLRSINVFHTGTIPQGCRGIETSKLLENIDPGSYLVGEFLGPGETPHALVVNKSATESIYLNFRFKEPGEIRLVNPFTGQPNAFHNENNWLAPGQGALLFLQK